MNLSTIEQGEEMLKRATPGPWFYDGIGYLFQGTPHDAQMVADDGEGKQIRMRGVGADLPLDVNGDLIAWLRNHASELLQMAREVEGMRSVATTKFTCTDECYSDWLECSICKDSMITPKSNFCPNCGAKIAA